MLGLAGLDVLSVLGSAGLVMAVYAVGEGEGNDVGVEEKGG